MSVFRRQDIGVDEGERRVWRIDQIKGKEDPMDRGIWATWYDLAGPGKEEYISWLHEVHIPQTLSRPGYLWAAHVENIVTEERQRATRSYYHYTDDPSVPMGNGYIMLCGAVSPHVFVDPSPAELEARMTAEAREMLGRRIAARSCIFVEVARVDGPEVSQRGPGITPGPAFELGSFNINALENEEEVSTWYARSRLPRMTKMPGCIGVRKLVSIAGWAKHGILYEFVSLEAIEKYFTRDPSEWSQQVIKNLVHAPGSPSIGKRLWPPA
ncbi:MAG: hypothetical protein HYY00_06520 [Chloroflexi bacterium]|nr:hypothetical protein [Chloroflexota bacterium]